MTDGPLHPSYDDGVVVNRVTFARPKTLTTQLVVRVPDTLAEALQRDADTNGRTLAQTVRFHLTRALQQKDPT